jgi:hypothetical protein
MADDYFMEAFLLLEFHRGENTPVRINAHEKIVFGLEINQIVPGKDLCLVRHCLS